MQADTAEEAIIRKEQRRVSMLRTQMLQLHPFWGYLLLQVRMKAAPKLCAMAATDCLRHIWYNPLRTRHLSDAQLGFVLAHEVGHQLLASAGRWRGRNQLLWNCATDYAINRLVADMDHPARPRQRLYEVPNLDLPDGEQVRILLDRRFDGKIAEAIYEYLAADELPDPRSVTVSLTLDDEDGTSGAAVTVPNVTDHGGGIDVHLPRDLGPDERPELRGGVAAAVAAWAGDGRVGHLPADLVRRVRFAARAAVPWRRLLRCFAGQSLARDDYDLCRPNRRYLEHDVVVPGLRSDRAGHVVVALDTSASVDADLLNALGSELQELCRQVERVTLLVADAEVQRVVDGGVELERFMGEGRLPGGGGTDHRPVFCWMNEQRCQPDLFVGLTDLYSRFPDRKPPYPVLWVTPAEHGKAPWGRVIELSQESN